MISESKPRIKPTFGRGASFWPAKLLCVLLAGTGGAGASAEAITHPLDPLSAAEYEAVVEVLEEQGYRDRIGLYPLITLEEPAKHEVLSWQTPATLPRRAFVVVTRNARTYEAVVDITARKVESWTAIEGVQPSVLLSQDWITARTLVRDNSEWQRALRERGFTTSQGVVCMPHTVGYYALPEQEGRRLLKVICYDGSDGKSFWGRPIEGLTVVVDLAERKVLKVIDTGIVPIPRAPRGQEAKPVDPSPAVQSAVQPESRSYNVVGQLVSWKRWQFRFRLDPLPGLVVSTVSYDDGGRRRSVLYQGSLSELFVPYMDPSEGWYFRTYMDVGEYGVGKLTSTLEPGLDCPVNATFFDAVFADDWGLDYTRKRAVCLFERYAGEVAWRHFDTESNRQIARSRTDLVLRSISTIGNYDYVFDWAFREDGSIEVSVGATGIEQVKAVRSRVLGDDADGSDTAYGRLIAGHTVAINHDHFFAFRLDLDVDGPRNSFVLERLVPQTLGAESPRRSIWRVQSTEPASETEARYRIDIDRPALWRVVNRSERGPLGYPVSYHLKPGANAVSLLSPDDFPQRRAGFTDFHLWVTPNAPHERHAAGRYPNQSRGGGGLPRWTRADRPIRDTDIVLWYTVGFHHVVRAEDWPILSTARSRFELRPFDFFARNPTADLSE